MNMTRQTAGTRYHVALIVPGTRDVLACAKSGTWALPSAEIPRGVRICPHLRRTVFEQWGVTAYVLDVVPRRLAQPLIIAEVLSQKISSPLCAMPLDEASKGTLSTDQCDRLRSMHVVDSNTRQGPRSLGWFDSATEWVENVIGPHRVNRDAVEQFNAGGGFVLLRFPSTCGKSYWLKATDAPNAHEYGITLHLAELGRQYSTSEHPAPLLCASRPEWNAWLMEEDGQPISALLKDSLASVRTLQCLVKALVRLQQMTIAEDERFLSLGAIDQRWDRWEAHRTELFSYLSDAMAKQESTRVAPLSHERIKVIAEHFEAACDEVAGLGLPATLIHGDLSASNITMGQACRFLDWSEAYIGSPLVNFAHVLLLNQEENCEWHASPRSSLANAYCEGWKDYIDPERMVHALKHAPLMGAFSALYGRGGWWKSASSEDERYLSYARTLGRHMDRAVRRIEMESGK